MTAEPAPKLDPTLTAELNHEISRHARLLHVLKSSMATHVPTGLDAAAFGLLITLVKGGALRQGELADVCLLDPSTVSRHVAHLARAGYVERRPDPGDGRAVQLVASDEGLRVAEEIGRRRQAVISEALGSWGAADAAQLIALLRRLNDDLDAFRPHIVSVLTRPSAQVPQQDGSIDQLPDPRTPDMEIA